MTKLIKSDLRLTLRHPIFIFGLFLTLTVNLCFIFSGISGGSVMHVFMPFCAVFFLPFGISVILMFTCGKDLSWKTVSRKLTMGYTKKQIYFSHLILALTTSLLFTLPCWVSIALPVILAKVSFGVLMVYYVYCTFALLSMTSVIVFITMVSKTRVLAFVLCFFVCGSGIFFRLVLTNPTCEKNDDYVVSSGDIIYDYGVKVEGEKKADKAKRMLYKALAFYSPSGFLYNISSGTALYSYGETSFEHIHEDFKRKFENEMKDDFKSVPFSLCVFSIFSFLGAEAFRRKDLS